jgi:hypothetical protein
MALAKNSSFSHSRQKHMAIQYFWIKEVIESGEVELVWRSSADQLADALTKAQPRVLHERHIGAMMGSK